MIIKSTSKTAKAVKILPYCFNKKKYGVRSVEKKADVATVPCDLESIDEISLMFVYFFTRVHHNIMGKKRLK